MNEAYNMDCLSAMREMDDNAFDLAVVDPPYGDALTDIGGGVNRGTDSVGGSIDTSTLWISGGGRIDHLPKSMRKAEKERTKNRRNMGIEVFKKIISWDVAPKQEYFDELFRISRNQVIWGGNYFHLPPTRCFLIWCKTNVPQDFSMSMAEYAWTSFNANAKVFKFSAVGQPNRFHPTQKPIELYEWIYGMFAKQGDKIIDTHMGSGSSRIASYRMGFDYVGYEIDKIYFDLQEERFAKEVMQGMLF